MALVTVYDPNGVAFQKESVDAKECIKHCGFSMVQPIELSSGPESEVSNDDLSHKSVKKKTDSFQKGKA